MSQNSRGTFLPTEILLTIISFIIEDEDRQSTLFSFGLVCQQWYCASVPFLYAKPIISARNYDSFARAIDVYGKFRQTMEPLGALVQRLDLGALAHSGSKSFTARLLRACRQRLKIFIAPASTFSVVNLTPMSKCSKLRIVDLSLLMTTIPFLNVTHAVRNLRDLEILKFPPSVSCEGLPMGDEASNDEPPLYQWPPKLKRLGLWKVYDYAIHKSFIWPESITSAILTESPSFPFDAIVRTLSAGGGSERIQRVNISSNRQTDEITDFSSICTQVPRIKFLSLRGCGCNPVFYEDVISKSRGPVALEILEISPFPTKHEQYQRLVTDLRMVFSYPFCRARRLGLPTSAIESVPESFELEMDEILMNNALGSEIYDKAQLECGEIQTGVYYF